MDSHAVRRPLGALSGNTLNGRGKTERDVAAKRVIVNKRVTDDGRNRRGLVIIAKIILRYSFKKWSHNIYTNTTTPSYVDIISHGMTANKESIFEVDDATVDASVGATSASENVGEDNSQNIKQDIITPKKRRFYSNIDDDVIEINTTATSGGIRTNRSNIGTPLTTASGGIRANNLMNTTTPLPLFGINKNSSNHTTPTGILQFPSAINSINRVDNKENTPTRVSNHFENSGLNKIPAPLEKLIDENEIIEEIEATRQPHVEKIYTPKPASPETEQPTVVNTTTTTTTTTTTSNNTTPEFPLAKDFEALHYAMVEATTASIKSLLLHHNARSGGSGSKFLQTRETVSYIETEYQEFVPNIDIKSVADSIKPVILSPLGHQGQPSGSTPYVPLCELSIYQDKVKLWKEKYGKEEKSNIASDVNTTDKTVKSDDVIL